LNVTDDVEMKPVPLMARACGGEPTGSELGDSAVIAGTGLLTGLLTVKISELVVVPLLVITVTGPEVAPPGTLV
jgi:hypothetical protein